MSNLSKVFLRATHLRILSRATTISKKRSGGIIDIDIATYKNIMAKDHGKQIKDDEKYEALRDEGMSKEKAARIANTPNASKKGGKASNLEDRKNGRAHV